MKSGAELLNSLAAGMLTVWRIHANPKQTDFLHILLTVLVWAAGLFLMSLLLPDDLAEGTQEFIGWCLAGTVATLALLASVKMLEGLLDS
jgi:hypothetical protein